MANGSGDFNPFETVDNLKAAGFEAGQAEALARELSRNAATKQDLRELEGNLKQDLRELEGNFKQEIKSLDLKIEQVKSELKRDMGDLRKDIEHIRGDYKRESEQIRSDLKKDMTALEHKLTFKLGVMLVLAVSALAALSKL